ncbi:MAG: 50S ribosomal protein L22, large subunit ribosomal protein L22 [candidate division WWE3 bacterium GW2011_GWC1_41_7]|nr:MAG: 50S ribosomal protein L22, large subunit ribosomal protein L22 [candidate division WWE3 bacterium GW2011_GWC1_41_7]KKS22261.1 MAG: 50S ribosomal protein L22 [candidate division WWE3 bacterium GW2011_GWA1_41_8]
MDMIRGKALKEAKLVLKMDPTKASDMILKTLESAEANARHNLNLKTDDLYVSEIYVNGGSPLKRGQIIAKSRFNPILKRTSHIVVGLKEREAKEGK